MPPAKKGLDQVFNDGSAAGWTVDPGDQQEVMLKESRVKTARQKHQGFGPI
jgi:hypothetical protein